MLINFTACLTELRALVRQTFYQVETIDDMTSGSKNSVLQIPKYLKIRFRFALRSTNAELPDDKKVPLILGVNAFHRYFEQVGEPFGISDQN